MTSFMMTTKWATDQSAIRTWPGMNIVIFTHNLGNWLTEMMPNCRYCGVFQQSYQCIEKSLNEMSAQVVKLSYDNRLLRAAVTQLHRQLELVPCVLTELARLRKSSLATEAKYAKVLTWFVELYSCGWCESRCLLHVAPSEMSDEKNKPKQLISRIISQVSESSSSSSSSVLPSSSSLTCKFIMHI